MADIGITYNSNPSRLIQQSGEFLSNNIRDIGKQIQGTILEINTKKDLARFAQNLQQNVNPNSEEFAQQAVQVAANHPLAIQDPRGQIALNILGKAHGEWKQAQLAVDRFGRPINVPGVGLVDPRTNKVLQATPSRPVNVYGQGLVDPLTGEVVVPEGTRQSPSSSAPRALSPGAILVDPTGKTLAENPKPEPTITPYQGAQLKRAEKKAAADALKTEISQLDRDITSGVNQYEKSMKREQEATTPEEKARHAADWSAIGKITDELKKKKEDRLKALRDLESAAVEETNADLLPPVTPNAAAPAPGVRRVPVFDPSGQPLNIREDQLDAALQAGWKRR